MSDNPNENLNDASDEHKKKMAELFGDLEDEEEETLDSLREERDELNAQVTRLSTALNKAQADNVTLTQKHAEALSSLTRAEEKFEKDKVFALEKFVKEVLPVVDTLELGLKAIPQASRESDPKFDKLAQGVEKTLSQLTAVFNKFGIREIPAMGEEFDASKHEALTMQEKEGVEPETVIQVAQKGYEIEGRVIRPAKVIVTPPG